MRRSRRRGAVGGSVASARPEAASILGRGSPSRLPLFFGHMSATLRHGTCNLDQAPGLFARVRRWSVAFSGLESGRRGVRLPVRPGVRQPDTPSENGGLAPFAGIPGRSRAISVSSGWKTPLKRVVFLPILRMLQCDTAVALCGMKVPLHPVGEGSLGSKTSKRFRTIGRRGPSRLLQAAPGNTRSLTRNHAVGTRASFGISGTGSERGACSRKRPIPAAVL
jgi:hypothetical protein